MFTSILADPCQGIQRKKEREREGVTAALAFCSGPADAFSDGVHAKTLASTLVLIVQFDYINSMINLGHRALESPLTCLWTPQRVNCPFTVFLPRNSWNRWSTGQLWHHEFQVPQMRVTRQCTLPHQLLTHEPAPHFHESQPAATSCAYQH